MGCGQSSDGFQVSEEDKRANQRIEEELKRARNEMRTEVKMLMLGAGESGKSTMVKQMRLMYREPYSDEERDAYREVVFSNCLQSMQAVIKGFHILEVAVPAHLYEISEYFLDLGADGMDASLGEESLDPQIARALGAMWQAPETRQVVRQAAKFQLNDSAEYFFDALPRLAAPHYIPTDQDILRTRVRSTGIVEERFKVKGYVLRVFDVGGQRSERKKWIHCFENVQVLVFVAAICEYDQSLFEDESINRLDESTMLFESIAGSRWFERSAFVLLLNKTDLFVRKLAYSPLNRSFPDYMGGDDEVQAKQYLLNRFLALDKKRDRRPLYSHFTCATDTAQVKVIMGAMMDTVLTALLGEVGLL